MAEPVRQYFFFDAPPRFYAPLDDLQANVAPLLVTPATVFRHNLFSVVETARLPYRLVSAGVYHRRFTTVQIAERIRARNHEDLDDQQQERIASEAANAKFETIAQDPEFRRNARIETEHTLMSVRSVDDHVNLAARELLRQVASSTWAALEILFRDVFVSVLNTRPDLVKLLRAHDGARTLFPLKHVPFEAFESYGFDLSGRMGDLLSQDRRMDSVVTMKLVLAPLLADPQLDALLENRDLRLLNQRRHVVVHRRGIVDAEYLANTGDDLPLGSELEILPADLVTYVTIVRDAGVRMLMAGTARLTERTPLSHS